MGAWIKQKLGNLVDVNSDTIKKNYPYKDIEYVDISSVGTGRLDGVSLMSFANAPSRAKRVAQHGDTILSTVRPNRRSFLYVKNPPDNRVFSTGFAVLHPRRIDSRFLYYVISQQDFTDYLAKNAKGAAYPAVDEEIICRAEIIAPDLSTQSRIASVLSTYDDLIENNEKRIEVLEEMAQRLYAEWFVKFNFPGHEKVHMVDSGTEYGMVPKGWEVRRFVDFLDIRYGKNLPRSRISLNGKYKVYGAGGVIGYYDQGNVTFKTALITCRGNGSGTVWRTLGEGFVTNNSFTVASKRESNDFEFVFNCLKNCNILSAVSGSAQPQITIESINFVKLVLPGNDLIDQFILKTKGVYMLADKLRQQNQNLSNMRDLLIPQLVTGKRELKAGHVESN